MNSRANAGEHAASPEAAAAERIREMEARIASLEQENGQLISVINSANLVSMIAADVSGIITLFNAGAERMLGYQASEVVGKYTPNLVHCPEEVERRAEQMSQELGRPISPRDVFRERARLGHASVSEWTYVRKDGSRFPVELGVTVMRDQNGAVTGYLGIASDLTERNQQQRRLETAIAAAEAAGRSKSEFLATMSHEIRTPMNGILGMASLLAASDLSPRQRNRAETLRESAEALLTVLNDVLDFSKMEAGKLSLEVQPLDLRNVAEGVADLMAVRAQEKGLELTCWIEPSVTTSLLGDASRLRQMMLNLTGNAVKFTDAGEVRLRIRAGVAAEGRPAPGRHLIRFEVTDTGIGIPADKHSLLFQRFSQADASTARRHGGTGLGLSIVRGLAEAMGGSVGCESEPGRGSTFWFQVELQEQAGLVRPRPLALPGKRILVAGHTGAGRRLISELLQYWQCEVILEPNAASALNYLAEYGLSAVDAAVLDLRTPHGAGRNLESQLYKDVRLDEIPVVLLTPLRLISGAEPPQQRSAYTGRVAKPVKQGELGAALAAAFGLAPVAKTSAAQMGPVSLTGQGMRILLVEDNPVNQEVAVGLLEESGYTVDIAGDAASAWPLLRQHRYAVVLMDCHLPDVDGYQLTRQIRQASGETFNTRVPVIAMTANAMSGDREKCLAAGMNDYVSKPVRVDELGAALDRWTGGRPSAAPIVKPPAAVIETLPSLPASPVPPAAAQPEAVSQPTMPTTSIAADPGFDAEDLLDRMMGSETLARRVVSVFLTDTPVQLAALAAALEQANSQDARRIAHSLKGSASNVGGQELSRVAAQAEKLGEAGDLAAVEQMLPTLRASFDVLAPVLNEFCRQ